MSRLRILGFAVALAFLPALPLEADHNEAPFHPPAAIGGATAPTVTACGTRYFATAALTLTLPQSSAAGLGCNYSVDASGGAVTIAVNAADQLNGGSAGTGTTLAQGSWGEFQTDGNGNWYYDLSLTKIVNADLTAGSFPNITGVGALTAGSLAAGFATVAVAQGGTGDTGTAWTAYTPTITCGTGTITSSSGGGRYKTLGKTVFIEFNLTLTNAGTCASSIGLSLPNTAQAYAIIAGREATSGAMLQGFIAAAEVYINTYSNTPPIATNDNYLMAGVYESQ